jgi:hypothetical protein
MADSNNEAKLDYGMHKELTSISSERLRRTTNSRVIILWLLLFRFIASLTDKQSPEESSESSWGHHRCGGYNHEPQQEKGGENEEPTKENCTYSDEASQGNES